MRLAVIIGSPRKGGNTETLVDRVVEGVRKAAPVAPGDVVVEKIHLQDLDLRFCLGCYSCHRKDGSAACVQRDDMHLVHEALVRSDAFVIGTPVYFFGPSAQTKVVLDRFLPLLKSKALRGKPMALAVTYGDADEVSSGAVNVHGTVRDAAAYIGINLVGWVHGTATEKGEIAKDRGVMDQALELGARLAGAVG